MQTEQLIPLTEFCAHYDIEFSFVNTLRDMGLIETVIVNEAGFIKIDTVSELEKFARLHYQLDINIEGIEAITYLLKRVRDMQQEITILKNRLRLYEGE